VCPNPQRTARPSYDARGSIHAMSARRAEGVASKDVAVGDERRHDALTEE
jgi:hypothetical protein